MDFWKSWKTIKTMGNKCKSTKKIYNIITINK